MIDDLIKQFGVNWFYQGKIEPITTIKSSCDYSHKLWALHLYVKKAQYYKNPEYFKNKQKLILLPKQMYKDFYSDMDDEDFYNKWNIERKELTYNVQNNDKIENDEKVEAQND